MAVRTKTSAHNAAVASTFRGLRGEKDLSFAELEKRTHIKEAQLERLFRNQATFTTEDFTTIAIAFRENPSELLDVILEKVRSE